MHLAIALVVTLPFVFIQGGAWQRANRTITECIQKWKDWSASSAKEQVSRRDAIERLDNAIWQNAYLAFLQRLTVMAPMLGVIITALGFMLLDATTATSTALSPESSASTILNILGAIQPLFLGVLLGAVLSIENQLVVLRFHHRLRGLREQAIDELAPDAFTRPETPVEALAKEVRGATSSLRNSSQKLASQTETVTEVLIRLVEHSAKSVEALCAACERAAGHLQDASGRHYKQLEQTMQRFDNGITRLTNSIESGAATVENQVEQSYHAIETTVGTLRERIAHAAASMERAIEQAGEVLDKRLEATSRSPQDLASQQARAMQEALRPLAEVAGELTSFAERAQAYARGLDAGAESLGKQRDAALQVAAASQSITGALSSLREEAVRPMQGSVQDLRAAAQQFVQVLEQSRQIIGKIDSRMDAVERGNQQLVDRTERAAEVFARALEALEQLTGVLQRHMRLLDEIPKQFDQHLRHAAATADGRTGILSRIFGGRS